MAVLDIKVAKRHLNLHEDCGVDDLLLTQVYMPAAEDHVAQYLNRPVPWKDSAGSDVPVPASVLAAMLLVLADLHENREAQFVGVTAMANPTVRNLLNPFRVGLGV